MVDEQLVIRLLLFAVVVLCACAYPRLNRWVYRRRAMRDAAAAAGRPAVPPPMAPWSHGRARR